MVVTLDYHWIPVPDFLLKHIVVKKLTKKQFPDCLPVLFAPAVGAVFLFASARLVAGSADVLIECSETASDERGIDACLSVVFEQAENRLLDVEQSWRKVLGDETTTLQAPVSQELVDQASDNPLSNDQPTTEQTDGPKVIAIVNDTALASGVGTGSGEIFNVDDSAEKTEALVNLSVDISARFEFIPALFRSYRDQHCAWQATVFGGDRVDMHYKACLTDQNRTRVSELNRSLAEIRSAAKGGLTMRGFYVKTNSGATFRACDRKIDWWVTGSETVLASLERRYVDANTRSVDASTGNFIYAELRGSVAVAPGDGPGADYASALQVEQINIFRPATPNDCVSVQQTSIASAAPQTDDLQSATVDDFAAAGFLYGYFNNWLSACSVTESSVCSAESEAQFASDGDWKLRVDRSLDLSRNRCNYHYSRGSILPSGKLPGIL